MSFRQLMNDVTDLQRQSVEIKLDGMREAERDLEDQLQSYLKLVKAVETQAGKSATKKAENLEQIKRLLSFKEQLVKGALEVFQRMEAKIRACELEIEEAEDRIYESDWAEFIDGDQAREQGKWSK